MTRDEITKANANTLNRLAATELMGWVPHKWRGHSAGGGLYCSGCGSRMAVSIAQQFPWCQHNSTEWNPSTDANNAATCLRKIEERGLEEKFVDEIPDVVGTARVYDLCGDDIWLIAKATPEQITRACLLAVCGE